MERPLHILYCEDTESAAEAFLTVFDDPTRYRVNHVTDGADGMATAALLSSHADPFDLIISDMEMPVMNGLQFGKWLQERPQLDQIPRIMYTGTPLLYIEKAARQSGYRRIIQKNLGSLEYLKDLVDAFIDQGEAALLDPLRD